MESDSDLVRRTLAGETESFRALVERYQDAVYGVALSKTGSFADAEDLAQEIFLAAYESLQRLKTPAKFGSWLYGIALNKTKMHLRSQTLSRKSTVQTASNPLPADELATRNETRAAIISALKSLSDAHRETATLYYINGYSQKDISKFTNRPLGTIKRRLHDARKQLRKELVTMVESELKSSRPKREFTDRVLRKISQVRVYASDKTIQNLLLTDSRGRSFVIIVGTFEGQAIEPWLSGKTPSDPTDIHSALVSTLNQFGRKIEDVVVGELKKNTFYATIKVTSGRRTVEVDSRPSDAMNFAVRAGTPIFVDKEVADQCLMKGKHGKPLSPRAAWNQITGRHTPTAKPAPFRNISHVLKTLEDDPENRMARSALVEATPGLTITPRRIADKTDAMEKFKSWVQRRRGRKQKGLANGLLGSLYLFEIGVPGTALSHLEPAHAALPEDGRIAFDLATAYTVLGRTDEAFSMLKRVDKKLLSDFGWCRNFVRLQDDPRFRSIVGEPPPKPKPFFWSAQLYAGTGREPKVTTRRHRAHKPAKALIGLRKIGPTRSRKFAQALGAREFLPVTSVSKPQPTGGTEPWLFLEVEKKRAAAIPLRKAMPPFINVALSQVQYRRPITHTTVSNILRAANIKLEAVALLKRTRSGINAVLVASADGKQAVIPIDAVAGISVAIVAKSPILITETLAEKLYVRGKSGRPLTLRGAARKLAGK